MSVYARMQNRDYPTKTPLFIVNNNTRFSVSCKQLAYPAPSIRYLCLQSLPRFTPGNGSDSFMAAFSAATSRITSPVGPLPPTTPGTPQPQLPPPPRPLISSAELAETGSSSTISKHATDAYAFPMTSEILAIMACSTPDPTSTRASSSGPIQATSQSKENSLLNITALNTQFPSLNIVRVTLGTGNTRVLAQSTQTGRSAESDNQGTGVGSGGVNIPSTTESFVDVNLDDPSFTRYVLVLQTNDTLSQSSSHTTTSSSSSSSSATLSVDPSPLPSFSLYGVLLQVQSGESGSRVLTINYCAIPSLKQVYTLASGVVACHNRAVIDGATKLALSQGMYIYSCLI